MTETQFHNWLGQLRESGYRVTVGSVAPVLRSRPPPWDGLEGANLKQLEEMIDGRKVTILVPEDETEQDRLEDMIFEQVRRGGDAKQYDAFHESHGRFVLSTTEESRYFSVRLNENGDPVVHEDD